MYKRYGNFRIADYKASWMALSMMIVFIVAGLMLKLSVIYIVVPILYSVAIIYTIWNPNRERFEIIEDLINVKKGKKEKEIKIPKEVSIVFSPVDICPPFSVRTAVGSSTHILKDKYAVSILVKMDIEEIIEKVHAGFIKKYTTSTIRNAFDEYKYVYSFVCDNVLLNQLLRERKANILIPKSIFDKIMLENKDLEIYVDSEC